jgi:hypothetical protein
VAHPTLEKYRGRLVSLRIPGLRGKRTGWIIDEDDEGYAWRDDLGDAEEQVNAGDLIPLIYLGEVEDGELTEGDGFLLLEPRSQDIYHVDEGSLEDETVGALDELVLTLLAGEEEEDEDDEDFVDEPGDDDLAGGDSDGVEEEEYKDDEEDEER